MSKTIVAQSTAELITTAAEAMVNDLKEAVATHGLATCVLAGGTLPPLAYRIIAEKYLDALDWSKVQFIIGDERCVPFDHPDANWSQSEDALLRYIKFPDNFISRPSTNLSAEEAADQYDQALQQLPKGDNGVPRLDHVWLGMGEDGHTLSLFPGHSSFLEATDKLVIPVHNSPKPPPDRISLTLKALLGATNCIILTAGAGKSPVIAKALSGDLSLPIAKAAHDIEQAGGQVTWLLDKAAAQGL